jgi:diadenosine tetraphosphate (Ap4A) HIT family hydrolase
MFISGCISCDTLQHRVTPPGGIVHENQYWCVFLRSRPLLAPGQGFIVLKRHCESLTDLSYEELSTLGQTMRDTHRATSNVLKPAKVHIALYAEAVAHIHFHVFPRPPQLPAGNIPVTLLGVWFQVLHQLGLKRAYEDAVIADLASQLRAEFQRSNA